MKFFSDISRVHANLFLFISIFFLTTCSLDDFDFDKLTDKVVYKPGLAFPIARAEATLMDFLDENDSTIIIDKTNKNLLKVTFDQDDLIDVSLSEVFDIGSVSTSISKTMTTEKVNLDKKGINKRHYLLMLKPKKSWKKSEVPI